MSFDPINTALANSKPKVIDLVQIPPMSGGASLALFIFSLYGQGGGAMTLTDNRVDWNSLWNALETDMSIRIVLPVEPLGVTIQSDEVTVIKQHGLGVVMLAFNFMMEYNNALSMVKVLFNRNGNLSVTVEPVSV